MALTPDGIAGTSGLDALARRAGGFESGVAVVRILCGKVRGIVFTGKQLASEHMLGAVIDTVAGLSNRRFIADKISLADPFACEASSVVDRSILDGSDPHEPRIARTAAGLGDAGLPQWLARFPIVGKDGDFRSSTLHFPFGKRDFWDHRQLRTGGDDRRSAAQQIASRDTIGDVVTVGAQGSAAGLADDFGDIFVVDEHAAGGGDLLAQSADHIIRIDQIELHRHTGYGLACGRDVGRVQENLVAGQRPEIHFRDGGIDRVGHEELFGGGDRFGGPATGQEQAAS